MDRAALAKLVALAADLAGLAAEIAAEASKDPDALIPIDVAATTANASERTLRREARAGGWLLGRQRSYSVRRSDLERWIESRRVKPLAGSDDEDIDARIVRLSKARRRA